MFLSVSLRILPFAVVALLAAPLFAGATPDAVKVPAVRGKTGDAAVALLEKAGLKVRAIQVAGPTVGKVATQDPAAGSTVAPGAIITIRVGTKPSIKTQMPDVVGQTVKAALETLTIAYDVHVQKTPPRGAPAGTVVRTEPPAGTELWLRGKVMIYVASSSGGASTMPEPERVPDTPEVAPAPDTPAEEEPVPADKDEEPEAPIPTMGTPVQLPDLTGKPLDVARKTLKRLGLTPNIVRVLEPGADPNSVVMQVPGGPSEVLAGDIVWLRIAQGAPDSKGDDGDKPKPADPNAPEEMVPALIGLDVLQASKEIVRRGLLPHPWYVNREGRRDWEVVAQKDQPGAPIARGGIVHFRTALPPHRNGRISMPYLYGLTAKQATEVLQGLGLPTKGRILDVSGRVTLQVPQAGAAIPWATPVTLTVGKVTDPAAADKVPLVELIPADTPIPPVPPRRAKKDGNILDDVGNFFERLFD